MSAIDTQFAFDFTNRYAPFLNPLPRVNSFREYLKFCPQQDRSGAQYVYPVQAAISHGQTADKSGGAFGLNAARPGVELQAFLDGTDLIMRETFPYSAMLKARNGVSLQGDAAAYWDPMDKVMMTTMRGMEHYNELMLMYGPGVGASLLVDIGVVGTPAVVSGGPTLAASPVINISRGSWAAGIWNNMGAGGGTGSGGLVDIYDTTGVTLRASNVQVLGVTNAALGQIQITQASPGTYTVVAGDRLTPAGWRTNTSLGVQGILENTGVFANISASVNPFWRARQQTQVSTLDASQFIGACNKLMSNGGEGSLTAFCNPAAFSAITAGSVAATRWINSDGDSNGNKTQGVDRLQFKTATGLVDLVKHEYMKQGQIWVLLDDEAIRVGASDITFRGANGNEGFFLELTANAGSEIRAISQQAALLTCPYHNLQFNLLYDATYWDCASST